MLKKRSRKVDSVNAEDEQPSPKVQETPRICTIDLDEQCVRELTKLSWNCRRGTLGPIVRVPNTGKRSSHLCLLNYDFPVNLHEYDIVILDLQNRSAEDYHTEKHTLRATKGESILSIVSEYPETLFDPRAFSASALKERIHGFYAKGSVSVVFAAEYETTEYQLRAIEYDGPKFREPVTHSLYDFYPDLPQCRNLSGRDTSVVYGGGDELESLLQHHNADATYEITFEHPTHWDGGKNVQVKDEFFIPLMEASPGKIVAFAHRIDDHLAFFFPNIRRKDEFLAELLEEVLPGIKPALFPDSTKFLWLRDPQYTLPGEDALLQEKFELENDFEAKKKALDDRIASNQEKHGYLHALLTQTGAALVKAVEQFLHWLEFENVVNVDETEPIQPEEDLRVEHNEGLLIIEVKGIGGTSKDSHCSQIGKVRNRRQKERKAFDVSGLYLVNHQRHMPAEQRKNPPFTPTQIKDAESDDRGLLTTYDLFKLYFNVTAGHVDKEDARKALLQPGLVQFQPSQAAKIPDSYEIHRGGEVLVFLADGLALRKGMPIILSNEGRYRSGKVLEIQVDTQLVESANSGEVGIKMSEKVSKGTEIWIPRPPAGESVTPK